MPWLQNTFELFVKNSNELLLLIFLKSLATLYLKGDQLNITLYLDSPTLDIYNQWIISIHFNIGESGLYLYLKLAP